MTQKTIENVISYPYTFDLNEINQTPIPLSHEEILDKDTNRDISLKLVDNDGRTILLIEVMSLNIEKKDLEKGINGCFIRRFEYVPQLLSDEIFSDVLYKFISTFVNNVKYYLLETKDKQYLSYYQYIWVLKGKTGESLIVNILDLNDEIFAVELSEKVFKIYKGVIKR